ncbi:hypothetical protein LVY74_02995 [Acinetobacter sp. ME22]|uniref:hypothetical protein n=1 Tax=Acinetobacter sp. ME22 TaxID=2904802 RepID=UPI001ED9FBAD|nr:hypothetical protein [Acinetobacter sp. ME22]MCG2572525.1 hypothetical protein [Acinetobacter sp. ME22]
MNIYKFSYDSKQDALNSLANYYQISVQEINSRTDEIKPIIQKLGSYIDQDIGFTLWEIRNLLNKEQRELDNPNFQISFYHRCITNGQQSWFEDGLLNSVDGIASFMHKVTALVPEIKNMNIRIESLQNIIREKGFNEEKSEIDGINGFYRLKDAKSSIGFDISEVFDKYDYHKIKALILSVLKPTVVKFYVERKANELDHILKNYWDLVLDDKAVTKRGANAGRGKTIPSSQIEKIIYLNRE